MSKVLVALALLTTLGTAGVLAATSATLITLDGQALQLVSAGVGLCAALVIPLSVSLGIAKSVEQRGRAVRRTPVVAACMIGLHVASVGALTLAVPDAAATVEAGVAALVPVEATDEEPDLVIETRGPAPGTTVEVAASQTQLSELLSGNPTAIDGLTQTSAAAIGVLWMRHLENGHPEGLASKVPVETYNAVYKGLKPAKGLWDDPAAVEPVIVPRGREFLSDVVALGDAVSARKRVGPMVWVALPGPWVAAQARGESPAWTGTYKRIERDKMLVTIAGEQRTLLREAGEWRLDLGPFGEVATQRPDSRMMWLALLR